MGALALSQEIHGPHLARCSPVIRVLGHSHNFECAWMFQVIAEVFSNGVSILEIFLFEEVIHQGHGACCWRVLLIDGPAFHDLGADRVKIAGDSRAAMMRHGQAFLAVVAGRHRYIRPRPSYRPPLGYKAKS